MDNELVSIADAAAEAGVQFHDLISWMHRSGAVLLIPDSDDLRCHVWMPGFEDHVPGCGCRFISAHPDVQPI